MTPLQVLQEDNAKRERAFQLRQEDGVIIWTLKLVLHFLLWHWSYRGIVRSLLCLRKVLHREFTERQAALWVRHMADIYMLLMSALLIWAYVTVFAFAKNITTTDSNWKCNGPSLSTAVLISVLYSIYRTAESYSVIVMLHANGDYDSPAPMRAISKTIWAYLEVVLAFAVFFTVAGIYYGDDFGSDKSKQFFSDSVNPLYFSMISIATIGYGDYAPTKPMGKWLVLLEVVLGVVLLVVALQRVLAVSLKKTGNQQAAQPGQPN